jgi:hypothetical protein
MFFTSNPSPFIFSHADHSSVDTTTTVASCCSSICRHCALQTASTSSSMRCRSSFMHWDNLGDRWPAQQTRQSAGKLVLCLCPIAITDNHHNPNTTMPVPHSHITGFGISMEPSNVDHSGTEIMAIICWKHDLLLQVLCYGLVAWYFRWLWSGCPVFFCHLCKLTNDNIIVNNIVEVIKIYIVFLNHVRDVRFTCR